MIASRVGFDRGAEGVVGGDEEKAVVSLGDEKAHERGAIRPVVRVPLDSIRRAGLAGQVRGRSAIKDDDPVARLGEVLKRKRDAGIVDVEDRPHAPLVVPLPGDLEPYLDLVLVVSGEKLNRLAEHSPTEILDRHARYCGSD